MSGSVTAPVAPTYHDSLWWELGGRVSDGITRAHSSSLKGCKVLWDRRRRCISSSPANPLCDYPVLLRTPCWKQASQFAEDSRRSSQRARSVWVLSLTARAAPHLNLNGSHLCCHHHANQLSTLLQWGFCASEKHDSVALIRLRLQQVSTSKDPPKKMLLFFSEIISWRAGRTASDTLLSEPWMH